MAGLDSSPPQQHHQALEESIADLTLQEKVESLVENAKEYVIGTKEPAKTSAGEAEGKSEVYEEKVSGTVCDQTSEEAEKDGIITKETVYENEGNEAASREVQIAEEEVAKSSDKGAYAVPAVDHRSYTEPDGGEKTEDIPTAIVHEDVDAEGKEQRTKGILQSVTGKLSQSVQSVKSVFSGITGSKSSKILDPKSSGIEEPKAISSQEYP